MRITQEFKRFCITTLLGIYMVTMVNPMATYAATSSSDELVYPIQEMSKLDCRFQKFEDLSASCKQTLPTLKTKDYTKYIKQNGGYNDYTRIYTVLWGSSYKYGWDVGNGGHQGTDIATSEGTPVYSMADGTVILAKQYLDWGNVITIEHTIRGKKVFSNYAHLSQIQVSVGQKVSAGKKIGEVGSTGNSTGNHLHFQVDLDTPFHPYYYDSKTCPYSYNDISETGVCFDELARNTVDPLLLLETDGKILDDVQVTEVKTVSRQEIEQNNIVSDTHYNYDMSIFDRTVYDGYPVEDIKEVQMIFRDLGEYNGPISGNYSDVEEAIISYQLSNNIISARGELGTGWFGPKTRTQAKNDYQNYLASGGERKTDRQVEIANNVKTEKISRDGLLSRDEIEKREVEDFIKHNDIELNLKNVGGNIELGTTSILKLEITNNKGRPFKGNMPSGMTFTVDSNKVKVFPSKLYYFTDGKRDIQLTGIGAGNTTLYVKIGNQVIKSIPLKVYDTGKQVEPEIGAIITNKSIVLGDNKTGIVVFRDENKKNLINLRYEGTYRLSTTDGTEVCIKRGSLKDIKNVYKRDCVDAEYKDYIDFSYDDTVAGLVLFDYKVQSKDARITLTKLSDNSTMSAKSLIVQNPKGLQKDYEYYDEVVDMLEEGVVAGINQGYFLEERGLVQSDGYEWIENTLQKLKAETTDLQLKTKINQNILALQKERTSKYNTMTREEFIEKAYEYLVFDNSVVGGVSIEYIDLDGDLNKKANVFLSKDQTWKDRFGENYFRPGVQITRGEGAYILSNVLHRNRSVFLASR